MWKKIDFLNDVYDDYSMNNEKEVRRIIGDKYYSIPVYKKGNKEYFDIRCTGIYEGQSLSVPVNNIYKYLFYPNGEEKKNNLLDPETVKSIRRDYLNGMKQVDISRKYKVNRAGVNYIVHNKSYTKDKYQI